MTTTPATLTTAPPHRGRTHATRGAAVRLIIPGRPQSKDRDHQGRLLDAAKTYLDAVRTATKHAINTPIDGELRLDIHLVYVTPNPLNLRAWLLHSIPNPDNAAALTLRAITGVLIHHRSQINPLTITRTILQPNDATDLYGNPHGATILTWDD